MMKIYKDDVLFMVGILVCLFAVGFFVGLALNAMDAEREFYKNRESLERTIAP